MKIEIMGIFSFLFNKKSTNIKSYLEKDALILDVRTKAEFDTFHFNNAINIPVAELKSRIKEIEKIKKPVIAHCRSGVRSLQAVNILKAHGIEATNGGGLSTMKKALE